MYIVCITQVLLDNGDAKRQRNSVRVQQIHIIACIRCMAVTHRNNNNVHELVYSTVIISNFIVQHFS